MICGPSRCASSVAAHLCLPRRASARRCSRRGWIGRAGGRRGRRSRRSPPVSSAEQQRRRTRGAGSRGRSLRVGDAGPSAGQAAQQRHARIPDLVAPSPIASVRTRRRARHLPQHRRRAPPATSAIEDYSPRAAPPPTAATTLGGVAPRRRRPTITAANTGCRGRARRSAPCAPRRPTRSRATDVALVRAGPARANRPSRAARRRRDRPTRRARHAELRGSSSPRPRAAPSKAARRVERRCAAKAAASSACLARRRAVPHGGGSGCARAAAPRARIVRLRLDVAQHRVVGGAEGPARCARRTAARRRGAARDERAQQRERAERAVRFWQAPRPRRRGAAVAARTTHCGSRRLAAHGTCKQRRRLAEAAVERRLQRARAAAQSDAAA